MIQRKEFDQNLEDLRQLLRQMGEHVERALTESITALQTFDAKEAKKIVERDIILNQMEEQVMDLGSRLIVTQQPVAKDLRLIIVAFKISSDLERMGSGHRYRKGDDSSGRTVLDQAVGGYSENGRTGRRHGSGIAAIVFG